MSSPTTPLSPSAPADLAEAIHAGSTPAELAEALAPHWDGRITNVEIAEDFLGWTVRVTIQPNDRRRRPITWAEHGETRGDALRATIAAEAHWAEVYELERE